MDKKVHQGNLTISTIDTTSDNPQVWITLVDEKSGTHFLKVRMPMLTWAQATVGNLGYVECEFELYADRVGMVQERKEEIVMIPRDLDYGKEKDKGVDIAVAEYEVDGWIGSRRDAVNWHRHAREQDTDTHFAWRVGYHRFVEDRDEELG